MGTQRPSHVRALAVVGLAIILGMGFLLFYFPVPYEEMRLKE